MDKSSKQMKAQEQVCDNTEVFILAKVWPPSLRKNLFAEICRNGGEILFSL